MTRTAITFMGVKWAALRCLIKPVIAYVCSGGMPQKVLQHRFAAEARGGAPTVAQIKRRYELRRREIVVESWSGGCGRAG
jgi:hypothetical protein